jgi:hypothetical protein
MTAASPAYVPAQEQPRLGRPHRGDQVGRSRRPAQVRRMPSRSLTSLPPRSLLRSPERNEPCLAGRAGSRHGGILSSICRPTGRNIPLKPHWLPAAGRQQHRNQGGCLVPPTLRAVGGGSDAVRRQVIQIAAGLPVPLSFPGLAPGIPRLLKAPTQACPPDPKAPPGPVTRQTRDGAAQVVRIVRS